MPSVGLTFGSVGDIITLTIVIKDLIKTLDEAKGASAEYQEITRELCTLDRVLLQVECLARECEETVELNALHVDAHRIVDRCRQSVESFLDEIQKYDKSLRKGGSKNSRRDAFWKLRWRAARSNKVDRFRAEINAYCSAISIILNATIV